MHDRPGDKTQPRLVPCQPYLAGNFAPVERVYPPTPCTYHGQIPVDLAGGQYVRNGANPVTNHDLLRDAHWFDGDGMLTGVFFRRIDEGVHADGLQPEFVNQFVLTDIFLSAVTTPSLRRPIVLSMATLIAPWSTLWTVFVSIGRTLLLILLSRLAGSQQAIKRISAANTAILYHDGRALATCESGPPIRVTLPRLETVGWFNGSIVDGEPSPDSSSISAGFGGAGLLASVREWTTPHPRVDPLTSEIILFHASFLAPYVRYSVLPSSSGDASLITPTRARIVSAPVPGMRGPKMMHDCGVSAHHTIILDLPLSLNPLNLARQRPVLDYDPDSRTRFGIFPRRRPDLVRWFETDACCIFHTANSWDEMPAKTSETSVSSPLVSAVNMLVCRHSSARLVYAAGNVPVPEPRRVHPVLNTMNQDGEDQSCLYYYRFDLQAPAADNPISHQWALSVITVEFPSVREDRAMGPARYVYGCGFPNNFSPGLSWTNKVHALLKFDVLTLVERGQANPPTSSGTGGFVDTRTVTEVFAQDLPDDPIQVFLMPANYYAQEPRFVPRKIGADEDDGWLLFYVYDEGQLHVDGSAPALSRSELWILDARNMRQVVTRVILPQRVPYGLHGHWFSEEQIQRQRPVRSTRSVPPALSVSHFLRRNELSRYTRSWWMRLRQSTLKYLGR